MIPCMFQSVVEMAHDETARYLMEQIIAGDGSGDNLPISYNDEEGTQADMLILYCFMPPLLLRTN